MENTQPSLFSRTLAAIIVFGGDNLYMILAMVSLGMDDLKFAAACVAMAIYTKLIEIRDGMSAPEITVTLNNKTLPHDEPTI